MKHINERRTYCTYGYRICYNDYFLFDTHRPIRERRRRRMVGKPLVEPYAI
jgi:hypothetical protein